MVLASNIKFLRNSSKLNQTEFGKLFNLTRGQVDSYERGKAKPSIPCVNAIAKHYSITIELLNSKDLKLNPGLIYNEANASQYGEVSFKELLKAKDDLIKEQRETIKFLQKYIEKVTKIKLNY